MDGDIIVNKDLSTLFNTDISEELAAVIIDSGSIYYKHKFVKMVDKYFNSGVMLLNLKRMREENITELLFDIKGKIKDDNLMDQNVFNIAFNNRIKVLSLVYNFLYVNLLRAKGKYTINDINKCYGEKFSTLDEILKNAYIVHYSSKDKPWKSDSNIGSQEWYEYFKKTPVFEKRREKLDGNVGFKPAYEVIENSIKDKQRDVSVSVIIPVYNTRRYLRQSVNSVLAQTLDEIEIIIIDDGSNDGSYSILKEYINIDNRIKLIRLDKNYGQSVARNIGLSLAKGKYVYFFDSDDILIENALKNLFSICRDADLDVLYFSGTANYENEDLRRLFPQYESYYKRDNYYIDVYDGKSMYINLIKNHDYNVSPCLQLIKTKYLKDNNILFYEGIVYEDNIFSLEVIINAKRAMVTNNIYFIRNVRSDSTVTSRKSFKNYEGILVVVDRLMSILRENRNLNKAFDLSLESQIKGYLKQLTNIYEELSVYDKNYIYRLEEKYILISDMYARKLVDKDSSKTKINVSEKSGEDLDSKAVLEFNKNKSTARSFFYYIYLKIKGGIRCYKEHGFIYTLKRIRQKISR